MKALTIHDTHARSAEDFCAGIEGEIAIAPMVCDRPDCGCDRSHAGLNSHAASSMLMVREVDLDLDDVVAACVGFIEDAGWATMLDGPDEVREFASDLANESVAVASDYATGTVLRPLYDRKREVWRFTEVA